MDKTSNLVRGYTWKSSGGAKACANCRAMHGKEFYFDPKPGQLSMNNLPRIPLHPNCRCKLIEIVDFLAASQAISVPAADRVGAYSEDGQAVHDTTDYDSWQSSKRPIHFYRINRENIQGGYTMLNVIWENNGRDLSDGPVYANHGGGDWEAGRNPRLVKEPVNADPEDDMDACFAQHDSCYNMFDEDSCDRELIKNLEALADDPRMWRNPPHDDRSMEYAIRYRAYALTFFKGKVYLMQNHHGSYGDDFVISP